MVQIIKAGKIKHIEVCRECGCEFSFEAEDVTKRVVWDGTIQPLISSK